MSILISFLLSWQKNLNEMAKKVAELFVEVLAATGVERIYGVASDSLNGITVSVRARKGIEWVGVRHERQPPSLPELKRP